MMVKSMMSVSDSECFIAAGEGGGTLVSIHSDILNRNKKHKTIGNRRKISKVDSNPKWPNKQLALVLSCFEVLGVKTGVNCPYHRFVHMNLHWRD